MSSNPLSYDGLKTVIQYMEAGLRYQLSCRIPSIRIVEKSVPLKFDALEFERLQTRVNQTVYRVGVYREYPDGEEVPKDHETKNANGGIPFDIIEHGFETVTFNGHVTPGDVDIPYPRSERYPRLQNRVFDQMEQEYEMYIRFYEKALITKLEQGVDTPIDTEEGPFDERNPPTVEQLREKIDYLHTCLIPYRCRRDNIPVRFTPLIQLTIQSPTGTLVYRHRYTLKLQQAMKKLNTALFGGRKYLLRTRSLNIANPLMVIRLPEGVRMHIQELRVTGNVESNYEALKSIVEETSYPLDSLTITDRLMDRNQYEHLILKSAETLIIEPELHIGGYWLPFLFRLKNKTIHMDSIRWNFLMEYQIRIVTHWLKDDKDVGTSLSYDIEGLKTVQKLLYKISPWFSGHRQEDNMIVLPMKNGNRLEVSYASIEQPDSQDEHQKFRVHVKVVAAPLCVEVETDSSTLKIIAICLRVSRFILLGLSWA